MIGLAAVALIASLFGCCYAQQTCIRSNVIYSEGPTYTNLSLENCQLFCQQNPACSYYTWNSQTRACSVRSNPYGGLLDSPGLYVGTPALAASLANKSLVGKYSRALTIDSCAQSCNNDNSCKSWTWYTAASCNSTTICVINNENPTFAIAAGNSAATTTTSTTVASTSSPNREIRENSTSTSALPSLYSGVKSCPDLSSQQCVATVNINICCPNSLPFVKNCGADQNSTSGTVTSPNYPNPYGNAVACVWNLYGPENTTISITINSMETEFQDKLFIYQLGYYYYSYYYNYYVYSCYNANETAFSGTLTQRSFLVPGNRAGLYFYSDASGSLSGFNITWKAIPSCASYVGGVTNQYNVVNNCGTNITASNGTITSPNYPNNYNDYNYCEWTLHAPAGTNITLTINAFRLSSYTYSTDRLFFLNPADCTPIRSELYSYSSVPPTIATGRNKVTLFFYSDYYGTSTGFNITWRAD